jgi:transcriptional regulator with XRE-family HTH domain
LYALPRTLNGMDTENAIGFELKAAREARGLSQREAAAALAKVPGLGDATSLSMRERGLREWSVGQYIAACELYDADPAGMLASILSSRSAQPVLPPGSGLATS